MKVANGEDTSRPQKIGSAKIEWNLDFDNRWTVLKSAGLWDEKYTFGEEGRIRLKGQCRHCWGGLIGKVATEEVPTAIRRRVCGVLLEGNQAKEEYRLFSYSSLLIPATIPT